jgi:hypothetical protein
VQKSTSTERRSGAAPTALTLAANEKRSSSPSDAKRSLDLASHPVAYTPVCCCDSSVTAKKVAGVEHDFKRKILADSLRHTPHSGQVRLERWPRCQRDSCFKGGALAFRRVESFRRALDLCSDDRRGYSPDRATTSAATACSPAVGMSGATQSDEDNANRVAERGCQRAE